MKAEPQIGQLPGNQKGRAAVLWPGLREGSTFPSPAEIGVSFFAGDIRAMLLGALRAADVLVIAVTAVFSYWTRLGFHDFPTHYRWQVLATCLIAANGLHIAGVYSFASLRRRSRHLALIAATWAASIFVFIAIIFFAKTADEISRSWLLLWAASSLAGLFALRTACWIGLARWQHGKLVSNVAVVGPREAAERLARRIEATSRGDVHVCGIFRFLGDDRAAEGEPTVDDLAEFARCARVDEVVVAIACPDAQKLERALGTLEMLPIDVKLGLCLGLGREAAAQDAPVATPTVLLFKRPLSGWRIVIKRVMDMALTAALVVALAPLMLLIAALVKLDSPGPVIFRQRRFGFNRQPITVYKFRTMYTDTTLDPTIPQARRNDPRVTRLGRFLRRSSLDELPQLFNVLTGTMSLIGPRPHAIIHDEQYAVLIDRYLARHRVLPGITGWAQINGLRGETDTLDKMKRRIEHDLFYIDHWSPLLDLRILAVTLRSGFRDPNAY